MPRTIPGEAFDTVCEVLNKVHQVRHTDWNLHVPTVRWVYNSMCKTLTTKKIVRLRNRVGTVISEGHIMMNPHIIETTGATVCEAQNKEVT